ALFLPSYGPEMRGGTANCICIVSDRQIGSPIVPNNESAIVMNTPSFLKFEPTIEKDGCLLINSALINEKSQRNDISSYYIPANHIAAEAGNKIVANIVMLGALLKLKKFAKTETIQKVIREKFEAKGPKIIEMNMKALQMGFESV
ncbi:MAG: 2-oxoacid:acceptor oxidoreductase family protein, partial [Caldisericia bacterium]|nr:2-oxoacid:acceptor oxidoreductase family protein [Caldisericia bacterium]